MISVIGGKLTTAAELARQCAAKIGVSHKIREAVAIASGQTADLLLDQWMIEIGNAGGISEDTARGIVEWHGKRALDISRMAQRSPELRAPLCSHSEHIVAEAVDAFCRRMCGNAGRCAAAAGTGGAGRLLVAGLQPGSRRPHRRRHGMGRVAIRGAAGGIRNRARQLSCASRRAWTPCLRPPPTKCLVSVRPTFHMPRTFSSSF